MYIYKTIIIEDEKPAARRLERLLSFIPNINVIKTIYSVEEGVMFLKQNNSPDLIFSDIVLGDGLSFDIFRKAPTKSFIIFTTAFDMYTLQAFKLNSIDYLLKPIMREDLEQAIKKFQTFLPTENSFKTLDIKALIKKEKLNRILVKIGYNLKIIQTNEVSCFFSDHKIVYLQTKERTFPTDFTLEELQEVLDENLFFRVNRQYIIQLNYIKNVHTSPIYTVELEMQPNEVITISRDRVKGFKEWLAK